jgi:hypothetical protein
MLELLFRDAVNQVYSTTERPAPIVAPLGAHE